MNGIKDQATLFCDLSQQISRIYEDYARSVGLSYTSLYALHMIALTENCTQKFIAEQLRLPKQTLNSVIAAFRREGFVELREKPDDKRHKTLHLTPKGNDFASKILPQIEAAEQRSMARFSPEDRKVFLSLLQRYVTFFASELHR